MRSEGERLALRTVVGIGSVYGYGNCIQALQYAWARMLREDPSFDDEAALMGGRVDGAWDSRPKKKLTKKQVAALMALGDSVLDGILPRQNLAAEQQQGQQGGGK